MRWTCLVCTLLFALSACKKNDPGTTAPDPPAPAIGSWAVRAPMPIPTQETTPAQLNGKLYVAGGFKLQNGKVSPSTLLQIYDPSSNTWSTGASLPRPMHHIGFTAANGKLYLLGGYTATAESALYTPTNFAYVYNPSTNSWRTVAPLPVARGAHVALTYNGKIYLFGGVDVVSNGSHRTDIYDPSSNTWSSGAPLPTVRDHVAGVVLDTLLYVIAGGQSHGNSNDVEAYSPSTNTWLEMPRLLLARHAPAVGVINGKIYVIGGETNSVTDTNEGEQYDPATRTWVNVTPIPLARSHIGGVVINGVLYVAGGSTPPRTVNLGTTGANDAFVP